MLNINKISLLAIAAVFWVAPAWAASFHGGGGSHGSFGGGGHSSFSGGGGHSNFGGSRGSSGGTPHYSSGGFGASHPSFSQHNNFQGRSSFSSSNPGNATRRNDIYDYTHRSNQPHQGFNTNRSFQSPQHQTPSNLNSHGFQNFNRSNTSSGGPAGNRPGNVLRTTPNQNFRTSPNGTRFSHVGNRTEMWSPNGTRTVRSGNGLIHERVFTTNNRTFVQRTFIRNNFVSVRNYTVTYWGRRPYYCYAPYYVYPAPFFGWYWRPWAPVYYSWWWYDDPWYGYYGYYWRPYPVYYGPGFWLTDFVIADILATAYAEDRAEDAARARDASYASINDEIKAEVRKEVDAELKAREHQASVPLDKAVSPGYVHVITKEMNVAVASSDESCTLSSGDIVRVAKTPGQDDAVVPMTVVTSKRGGCRPNTKILVSLDDVQDMKNHFSESVDRGLEKLREKQGKDGLPAAPADAQKPPQETVTPEEKASAMKEAESAGQELQSEYPTNENLPPATQQSQ